MGDTFNIAHLFDNLKSEVFLFIVTELPTEH